MTRIPRRLAGIGASDLSDNAEFDSYVGPAREITVDPVRGIIALHDGTTPGGKQFDGLLEGKSAADFATVAQGMLADSAIQPENMPMLMASEHGVLPWLDCTDALDALFDLADSLYAGIQLPIGNFIYNGQGWNSEYPFIEGASRAGTVIVLGNNSRLIDSDQPWGGAVLRELTTVGGKGAMRNTFTGVNVAGKFFVEDCSFRGYTSACIENNAADMPYWTIRGNVFEGANYLTTIGIALRGWADSNQIDNNGFLANKCHIKIRGGQNCYLRGNDFLRFDGGNQRIDVWVIPVPSNEYLVAGQGFTMRDCKFGSEHLDPSDFAVLYADEGAGASFGEKLPIFSASSGVISGHKITDCTIFGTTSNPTRSLIYSTTPDIRGSEYGPIRVGGTPPKHILEFSSDLPASIYNQNSILGPVLFQDQQAAVYQNFKLTNQPSIGHLLDATGVAARTDTLSVMPYLMRSSTGWEDFENLLNSSFTSGGYAAATGTGIQDAFSGSDAIELSITGDGGYITRNLDIAPTKGKPVWFDFDLAAGSSSPMDFVTFRVRNLTSNEIEFQEFLKSPQSPTDWKEYRLLWIPRNQPVGGYRFEFSGAISGQKIKIGSVMAYHARQPLSGSVLRGCNYLPNSNSIPTAAPAGGGYLVNHNGIPKWLGPDGVLKSFNLT